MPLNLTNAALLVIDAQKGFLVREAAGVRSNNPKARYLIEQLLTCFRDAKLPILHIHHHDPLPNSNFYHASAGIEPLDEAKPLTSEPVFIKRVSSGFIGTELEAHLHATGITRLIVVGAATNYCVETTARMAGNLGFDTYILSDATWTYDRTDINGVPQTAEAIHTMTLSNLQDEFATVIDSAQLFDALQ